MGFGFSSWSDPQITSARCFIILDDKMQSTVLKTGNLSWDAELLLTAHAV